MYKKFHNITVKVILKLRLNDLNNIISYNICQHLLQIYP